MTLVVVAACGGSGGSGGTATVTSPTPTPPTTVASSTFQGTIAGRNQFGTLTVTIQAVVSAASIRTLAVAQATGSIRPAGGASVPLTGTFDDVSRVVSLSGGGYTLSGSATGGALTGTYTGPGDARGGFSGLSASGGAVMVFCGIAEEDEGPIPFALQVAASGAVSGMIFGDPACFLTGRATGATVFATDCENHSNTGTIQAGVISGLTPSGAFFSGSASACQ